MHVPPVFTPGFRPRFRGFPPCFVKKFSFNNCSVWLGKCRPISIQVLSSSTILANRLSCSSVSSLPGLRDVTARWEAITLVGDSPEPPPKTSELSDRFNCPGICGNANSRLYVVWLPIVMRFRKPSKGHSRYSAIGADSTLTEGF